MTATTHSHATRRSAPSTASSTTGVAGRIRSLDRVGALALYAPLLLWAHGILAWVDGLDNHRGSGVPWAASGLALVAAVTALTFLAAELGERTGRGPLAFASVVATAFGAGAVGATTLGRLLGVLTDELPAVLSVGGPVLVGLGLAVMLARLVTLGRMPLGSALLAGLGAALVAAPLELLPLGALLLVVALAPLTRPSATAQPAGA